MIFPPVFSVSQLYDEDRNFYSDQHHLKIEQQNTVKNQSSFNHFELSLEMERFKYLQQLSNKSIWEVHLHLKLCLDNPNKDWPPITFLPISSCHSIIYRIFWTILPMMVKVQDVCSEGGDFLRENVIVSVGPIFSSLKVSHFLKHHAYKNEAGTVPDLRELTKKQGKHLPLIYTESAKQHESHTWQFVHSWWAKNTRSYTLG